MQKRVLDAFMRVYDLPQCCVIEIKVENRPLMPHQKTSLARIHKEKWIWKHPDMGVRNPWDATLYVPQGTNSAVIRIWNTEKKKDIDNIKKGFKKSHWTCKAIIHTTDEKEIAFTFSI